MPDTIRQLFLTPPMAVARLGESTAPLESYAWVNSSDPRADGETALEPDWSLRILPDQTVEPYRAKELTFKDDNLIRPVCPFFELWALVGSDEDPLNWTEQPVTPALLESYGLTRADLQLSVSAYNKKAARRTSNPDLVFGTFPPMRIRADNYDSVPILAVSPPALKEPMIPYDRDISLGSVQFLRSREQPSPGSFGWDASVRVDVIRFRVTPGRGYMYGPEEMSRPQPEPTYGEGYSLVDRQRAFLNPMAGWYYAEIDSSGVVQPYDTYDGASVDFSRSLGIVDDTCDMHLEITLTFERGNSLSTSANVFVGPPHFAPDKRPFISAADEINDRAGDRAARSADMSIDEKNRWVEDLFERVYELVSLFNVDWYRNRRASTLTEEQMRPPAPPDDGVAQPDRALGARDRLRSEFKIEPPSDAFPLPLSDHARTRHRKLSDIQSLRDFVRNNPGRLQSLVRQPFEVDINESYSQTTMKMPPFMRQSNALPLTLCCWQYDLLMEWVKEIEDYVGPIGLKVMAVGVRSDFEQQSLQRRDEVLEHAALRLDGGRR